MARRDEGAYPKRSVTEEQRSKRAGTADAVRARGTHRAGSPPGDLALDRAIVVNRPTIRIVNNWLKLPSFVVSSTFRNQRRSFAHIYR
jgi:hypothetical protein